MCIKTKKKNKMKTFSCHRIREANKEKCSFEKPYDLLERQAELFMLQLFQKIGCL